MTTLKSRVIDIVGREYPAAPGPLVVASMSTCAEGIPVLGLVDDRDAERLLLSMTRLEVRRRLGLEVETARLMPEHHTVKSPPAPRSYTADDR
jgi:hypothetical protein